LVALSFALIVNSSSRAPETGKLLQSGAR